MKIFLSGGSGFVGRHLVGELLRRGHEIRMLVHRLGPASPAAGLELVEGDVVSQECVADAAAGCDAVINLVGIIREFPGRGITFERLHVQAAAHMLEAARRAGIRRYLQMSALGTRPGAVSRYHQTKFRAEELVRSSGLDCTIFRPSLIYGPGDSFITMLAGQLKVTPVIPVIGRGDYRLQPIHVADVARCFVMSLDMPETIGRSYELCGADRFTYVELLDLVAAALGRSAPLKVHAPLGMMKLIIPVMQHLPQFPITADQLQMLLEESICDGAWQGTFPFEPRNFAAAIREYLTP